MNHAKFTLMWISLKLDSIAEVQQYLDESTKEYQDNILQVLDLASKALSIETFYKIKLKDVLQEHAENLKNDEYVVQWNNYKHSMKS